jgi:hypothetical protein
VIYLAAPSALAQAHALSTGDAHADRLLERFAVPLPAGPLTVHRQACPGTDDATCADVEAGVLWFAYGDVDRFSLAHEIGHVYLERDLQTRLAPRDAGYWRGRLSILLGHDPATPWDGLDGPGMLTGADCWGDTPCPSEEAADAYAACALRWAHGGRRRRHGALTGRAWDTPYGYQPTRRQHRRICRAIRSSGSRVR